MTDGLPLNVTPRILKIRGLQERMFPVWKVMSFNFRGLWTTWIQHLSEVLLHFFFCFNFIEYSATFSFLSLLAAQFSWKFWPCLSDSFIKRPVSTKPAAFKLPCLRCAHIFVFDTLASKSTYHVKPKPHALCMMDFCGQIAVSPLCLPFKKNSSRCFEEPRALYKRKLVQFLIIKPCRQNSLR